MNVVLRSSADPAGLTSAVRNEIKTIDPDLPMYGVRTMEDRVSASLATRRFAMLLLTLFAVVAMVLAAIGIYGVLAYLVNQGTRELGIRLALGATPRGVRMLVLRQGAVVTAIGIAIGLVCAFITTRFMSTLLFEISASDPVTFIAVPIALSLVAIFATYVPARRAASVDPARALRT
jgi:ABC-type antimicrobial peptide transport system permease subunit